MESPRLGGPLVRCQVCSLVYVGRRDRDFAFTHADETRSRALAQTVQDLGLIDHRIEDAEAPWRHAAQEARLNELRVFCPAGRLLDVGCNTGSFLDVASASFATCGVDPDPVTSAQARAKGHRVTTGTAEDVTRPDDGFDVVTMFHVIEHLASPSAGMERLRQLLRPGGVLMLETPTIDCLWFRIAPRKWRQLLPEHYFFFSRRTLERMLVRSGFRPIRYAKIGRRVSLRFAADRLGRMPLPLTHHLVPLIERAHLGDTTIYLNPGDIMSLIAVAE